MIAEAVLPLAVSLTDADIEVGTNTVTELEGAEAGPVPPPCD